MSGKDREYGQVTPQPPPDGDGETVNEQAEQTGQIIETGAITSAKGKYTIHCLTIVGQIEGHYILPPQNKTTKYEHVIPQLVAIQENPEIEGLIIILNTVGGDVEAGLAIAELVSGMSKPTVSLVLGGGHSIGVPLAVSAKKSFIAPSATMTIHPVRMNGLVLGVPQTLSYFDRMQDRIVDFVAENSNVSPKKFRQLMMNTGELVMDVGTVLNGRQAVEAGLIDYLGGLSEAIRCLYDLIEENRPAPVEKCDPPEKASESRPAKKQGAGNEKSGKSPASKRKNAGSAALTDGDGRQDDRYGEDGQVRGYTPAYMREDGAHSRGRDADIRYSPGNTSRPRDHIMEGADAEG